MFEINSIIQLITNGSIGAVVLFLFLIVNKQWKELDNKQKKDNGKLQETVIHLVETSTRSQEKMTAALDRLAKATEKQTLNYEKLFKQTTELIKK